jgi:hypothetical protein
LLACGEPMRAKCRRAHRATLLAAVAAAGQALVTQVWRLVVDDGDMAAALVGHR